MSILPSRTQVPTSSSSSADLSSNPHPAHGNGHSFSPPSPFLPPNHRHDISFGSFHISDSHPPSSASLSIASQGSVPSASAEEGFSRSSKEVTESGTPYGMESSPHLDGQRHSQSGSSGMRAQSKGKMSGGTVSPRDEQSTGPNSQGSMAHSHSAGRRAHTISGNHLLNFHYNPIARPQSRAPPPAPRRQYKIKPYNKDLFLQANYKFVVLDTGNYAPESMDPDKKLQWEDIICMRYSTTLQVQCPICLEDPLCPQITSCGHIFCFPCILRYLLMGEEDHKGDCFKKCPLCFVMMSLKDLYTIYLENVKQHNVGDNIDFMLLTRQKDSFTLSRKHDQDTGTTPCSKEKIHDPFAKFTFTSDIDLSVRQAKSDLDSWLVRAESGLVDDLEKLPYVCAALEQLEQRKKRWKEHWYYENNISLGDNDPHMQPASSANATNADIDACNCGPRMLHTDSKGENVRNELLTENRWPANLFLDKSHGETGSNKSSDEDQSLEGEKTILSTSYDESKALHSQLKGSGDIKDKDSYNFYQAVDGQHIILHPLNMKCLLQHYGTYDILPHRISGKILQFETVTQSEAMRKRYRYLSHFSLTTVFQLCEIDLNELLPLDALLPFMEEIKKREKQRKQLAKKEWKQKIEAEAAAAAQFVSLASSLGQSSRGDSPAFSMDDFKALGSSTVISSSPPTVGQRKLFSSVTKLGFAAGHDSPGLTIEETSCLHNNGVTNDSTGSRNSGTPSFANIISREKSVENSLNAKKGKKQSRVLLSTSGGRRY